MIMAESMEGISAKRQICGGKGTLDGCERVEKAGHRCEKV